MAGSAGEYTIQDSVEDSNAKDAADAAKQHADMCAKMTQWKMDGDPAVSDKSLAEACGDPHPGQQVARHQHGGRGHKGQQP